MRIFALTSCAALLVIATSANAQSDTSKMRGSVGIPTDSVTDDDNPVDPEAVAALRRMSQYLSGIKTFELTSDSSLDVVTNDAQRLQIDAVVHYKVMQPGIWINYESDLKHRQYFYDGKNFTIFAPKMNFYASAPAPATNREFLKAIDDKFGISLPLEDLFRWNDGDDSDIAALTSAFNAGTATLNGVKTDHWAFRQGDFDWEVWIEQGARPLPRKLVIVDRTDPTMPAYIARLNWVVNPTLKQSDFTYVPAKDAMRIQLATLTKEEDSK